MAEADHAALLARLALHPHHLLLVVLEEVVLAVSLAEAQPLGVEAGRVDELDGEEAGVAAVADDEQLLAEALGAGARLCGIDLGPGAGLAEEVAHQARDVFAIDLADHGRPGL